MTSCTIYRSQQFNKRSVKVRAEDLGSKGRGFELMRLVATSATRLGDFLHVGLLLKPLATINLPRSPTFLGNFCKGVKIYPFSSEIIFGQLL